MAVLLQTSKGEVVIDLYVDECPLASQNLLKLCKVKYYHGCLFHNVQKGFVVQTGDPEGEDKGGTSIWGMINGSRARFFKDEVRNDIGHSQKGRVGMAGAGKDMNGSQFYITSGDDIKSLDGKHTVFGEVAEGMGVIEEIDNAHCDERGMPYRNIRIQRAHVVEDPFDDPPGLAQIVPEGSPAIDAGKGGEGRLEDTAEEEAKEEEAKEEEKQKEGRREEARSRAAVLEMVGDIPDAEVKPPENMLFVCKLNPETREDDLEVLFSRFGQVTSCDVVRDSKSGDSLQYAFVGFDDKRAGEEAYFRMNNVLVDDRRIKVDFSQSVYTLWRQYRLRRRGAEDEAARRGERQEAQKGERSRARPRSRSRERRK